MTSPPSLTDLLSPEQQQTLLQVLKLSQLNMLLAALLEVQAGSGYGAVELVIADGRVQTVKVVKSMKA